MFDVLFLNRLQGYIRGHTASGVFFVGPIT